MKKTPLEKRIKRRVTARKQLFFAVTPPGLKRLCHREISRLPLALEEITMIPGGVEFKGSLHDCYAASLHLRSPSRITMRIARFKAENFRTLEKKLNAVEWELYLSRKFPVACEVSTHHSRLYHKDAIAERTEAAVRERLESLDQGPPKASGKPGSGTTPAKSRHSPFTLFIRAQDDQFEISLDASGELLHKRGIKKEVGKAPLRENLAFAVLCAAGFTGEGPLVDPMCGSGTFSMEGTMIKQNIPPGFFRPFAFEQWPCFSRGQWRHLKQEAEKAIIGPETPEIFASDLDETVLGHLQRGLTECGIAGGISVFRENFFDLDPRILTGKKGVVVLNPPYGKRIGNQNDVQAFFARIGDHLKEKFTGWQAGIVLPDKGLVSTLPFSAALTPVFHGGLEIFIAAGKIR